VAQAQIDMPPCHTMATEQSKIMEKTCSACTDSEKLWSQDLVFTNGHIVLQGVALTVIPFAEVALNVEIIDIVRRDTVPDPPDIAFYASPLRTQEGIVLLN